MNTYEITLQDENFNLHNIMKVKDTIYDPIKRIETEQWLWVYSETSVFFYIELWFDLHHAQLNQILFVKNRRFKVVDIKNMKIRYS